MKPDDDRSRALDAQISQVVTAWQQLFSQLGQGWAALVAADVVLLGYAIAQRQAWWTAFDLPTRL